MLVNFVGRLGSIPERKVSRNGNPYYVMAVAINEYSKGNINTIWVNVITFDASYSRLFEKVHKGTILEIGGDLHFAPYIEKNTNVPKCNLNINAHFIRIATFSGSERSQTESSSSPTNSNQNSPKVQQTTEAVEEAKSASVSSTDMNQSVIPSFNASNVEDDLPF